MRHLWARVGSGFSVFANKKLVAANNRPYNPCLVNHCSRT